MEHPGLEEEADQDARAEISRYEGGMWAEGLLSEGEAAGFSFLFGGHV